MPKPKLKDEIVTFKADGSLLAAMKGVPNRSEFIRTAVLAALDSACPVCRGTGVLTPDQRAHWKDFAAAHTTVECDKCHEVLFVCTGTRPKQSHGHAAKPRRKPSARRSR